jgi:hypothetical protein
VKASFLFLIEKTEKALWLKNAMKSWRKRKEKEAGKGKVLTNVTSRRWVRHAHLERMCNFAKTLGMESPELHVRRKMTEKKKQPKREKLRRERETMKLMSSLEMKRRREREQWGEDEREWKETPTERLMTWPLMFPSMKKRRRKISIGTLERKMMIATLEISMMISSQAEMLTMEWMSETNWRIHTWQRDEIEQNSERTKEGGKRREWVMFEWICARKGG